MDTYRMLGVHRLLDIVSHKMNAPSSTTEDSSWLYLFLCLNVTPPSVSRQNLAISITNAFAVAN